MFKKTISFVLSLLLLGGLVLPVHAYVQIEAVSETYASGPFYENLKNVQLNGDMRHDIMEIAASQIGYREGDSIYEIDGTSSSGTGDYTEFHNFMNYQNGSGGWCGMFVSFCAAMAGIPETIVKRSVSASPRGDYGFRFYGPNKLEGSSLMGFYDLPIKGGSYVPSGGDLIFFARNNSASDLESLSYKHVGLVESCSFEYASDGSLSRMLLVTIEGNYSEQVKRNTYKLYPDSSGWVYAGTYIASFGVPAYEVRERPASSNLDIGSFDGAKLSEHHDTSGEKVIALQQALSVLTLRYPSIHFQNVNNHFDIYTTTAVKSFQELFHLPIDGIVGKETWQKIREECIAYTSSVEGDFLLKDGRLVLFKGKAFDSVLPEGVTEIAPYAFYNNRSLKNLTLPYSLQAIRENAFYKTSLKTLVYSGSEKDYQNVRIDQGNSDLNSALLQFKPGFFEITFQIGDRQYKTNCAKNEIPVCPVTPAKEADGEYVYHFASFDKELVPATENAVYTALFFNVPNCTSKIHGSSLKSFQNGELSFQIYLKDVPEFIGISRLKMYLPYGSAPSYLVYLPEKSTFIPELQIQDTGSEILLELTDGLGIYSDTLLATLVFQVKKEAPPAFDLLPTVEILSVTDGNRHYPQKHEVTPFHLDIQDENFFDMDADGAFSINDVTNLLNILAAGTGNELLTPFEEPLSIAHVTMLLNLLSSK